jgi:hypothetical protein
MFDMSTQVRVIAFNRQDAPLQLRPRRDDRLRGGDTVYLVGPYRELLATLRRGLPPREPATGEARNGDDHEAQAAPFDVGRQAKTG